MFSLALSGHPHGVTRIKTIGKNRAAGGMTPRCGRCSSSALAIAAVIGFLFYIVSNALTNLAARGITTGFDFLGNTAGFGILQSLIPYDETYTFGRTFVVGLLNTLLVSVLGILFATLLGFALGVARLSRNWLVAKIAAVYIETFRNIPLLLQIFFWYFSVLRTLPSRVQAWIWAGSPSSTCGVSICPKPCSKRDSATMLWALVLAVLLSWGWAAGLAAVRP